MVSGHAIVKCPFCEKIEITAFKKPSFLQGHKSSCAAKSRTKYYRVPESYFIQSDCPYCGAKKKDIQDWYDGKFKKKMTHEERIEMFKKRGLPLVLGSKKEENV